MAIHANVSNAFDVAKDNAVSTINLTVDTSRWSSRKRNIVVKAIHTGVAVCGWDTGRFVEDLLKAHGLVTQRLNGWNDGISIEYIKPSLREELYAYVAAMLKISTLNPNDFYNSGNSFLRTLERGDIPDTVPIPKALKTSKEKYAFLKTYARDIVGKEKRKRDELAEAIMDGKTLSISYDT